MEFGSVAAKLQLHKPGASALERGPVSPAQLSTSASSKTSFEVHDDGGTAQPVKDMQNYSPHDIDSSQLGTSPAFQTHDTSTNPQTAIPTTVPVICGPIRGTLLINRCKVIIDAPNSDGREVTPTEFERLGGREATKKWKQSIRVLNPDGQPGRPIGDWLSSIGLDLRASHPIPPMNAIRRPKPVTVSTIAPPARKEPVPDEAQERMNHHLHSCYVGYSHGDPTMKALPYSFGSASHHHSYDMTQMGYDDLFHLAAQRTGGHPLRGLVQPPPPILAQREAYLTGQRAPRRSGTEANADPAVAMAQLSAYLSGERPDAPWNLLRAQPPTIHGQEIDLRRLYQTVMQLGGFDDVVVAKAWASIVAHMGLPQGETSTYILRNTYQRFLLRHERQEVAIGRYTRDLRHTAAPAAPAADDELAAPQRRAAAVPAASAEASGAERNGAADGGTSAPREESAGADETAFEAHPQAEAGPEGSTVPLRRSTERERREAAASAPYGEEDEPRAAMAAAMQQQHARPTSAHAEALEYRSSGGGGVYGLSAYSPVPEDPAMYASILPPTSLLRHSLSSAPAHAAPLQYGTARAGGAPAGLMYASQADVEVLERTGYSATDPPTSFSRQPSGSLSAATASAYDLAVDEVGAQLAGSRLPGAAAARTSNISYSTSLPDHAALHPSYAHATYHSSLTSEQLYDEAAAYSSSYAQAPAYSSQGLTSQHYTHPAYHQRSGTYMDHHPSLATYPQSMDRLTPPDPYGMSAAAEYLHNPRLAAAYRQQQRQPALTLQQQQAQAQQHLYLHGKRGTSDGGEHMGGDPKRMHM